jgi:hypothetical protein
MCWYHWHSGIGGNGVVKLGQFYTVFFSCLSNAGSTDAIGFPHQPANVRQYLTGLSITGDAICNRMLGIHRLKTAAPNHYWQKITL